MQLLPWRGLKWTYITVSRTIFTANFMGIAWTVSEIMEYLLFSWLKSVWLWMKVKVNIINVTHSRKSVRHSIKFYSIASLVSKIWLVTDRQAHSRHAHRLWPRLCWPFQSHKISARMNDCNKTTTRKMQRTHSNNNNYERKHCIVHAVSVSNPPQYSSKPRIGIRKSLETNACHTAFPSLLRPHSLPPEHPPGSLGYQIPSNWSSLTSNALSEDLGQVTSDPQTQSASFTGDRSFHYRL